MTRHLTIFRVWCGGLAMVAAVACLVPRSAFAAALSYEGRITNPDGTAITATGAACVRTGADTCDFRVRLYTAVTDGTRVWEQVMRDVEIGTAAGSFVLTLDCGGDFDDCAIGDGPDFAAQDLYVEVAFDPSGNADFAEDETFVPRALASAAPYAFAASDAARLDGHGSDAFVRTDADSTIGSAHRLTIDGTLRVAGDFSVGDRDIALTGAYANLVTDGDFSVNTSQLFVQRQTGRVGVGTVAPDALLAVHGDGSATPLLSVVAAAATDTAFAAAAASDSLPRILIGADGGVQWGSGSAAPDVSLRRTGVGTVATDGILTVSGALGVGVAAPAYPIALASGAHVTAGGVWTNASDRALKENITPIDGQEILAKIAQLQISRWNYKNEEPSVMHIGPMAQDFFAVFGLGGSDTSISTIDPAGVALLGIQTLRAEVVAQQDRLSSLSDDEVARLADDVAGQGERITDLEHQVEELKGTIDVLRQQIDTLTGAYMAIDPAQVPAVTAAVPIAEETSPIAPPQETDATVGDDDATTATDSVIESTPMDEENPESDDVTH